MIDSNGWSLYIDDVMVEEIPTEPIFSITPESKNFGSINTGASSTEQIFTITNVGGGNLIIEDADVSITGADAAHFGLSESNAMNLEMDESGTLAVTFAPTSVGEKSAFLTIVDNTADDKATHNIPLAGTGVIGNPGSFTAVADGSDQIDLSWTKNANGSDVIIAWNSENVFGTPTETYSLDDLIDGGGTVIYIGDATAFEHKELASATKYYYRAWSFETAKSVSYSSGVSANATTEYENMVLMDTGTVDVEEGEIISFFDDGGPDANYSNSMNLILTFNAPGGFNVKVDFQEFNTESGYDFLRIYDGPTTSDPLLATLSGNIDPDDYVSSHASGALTFHFTSDSSVNFAGWYAIISLEEKPAEPIFSITPGSKDFGDVNIGDLSAPQEFTIRNTGGGTLIINPAVDLSGTNADQFSLSDTNTYPLNLEAGESAIISVTFSPTSAGEKTANLSITDNITEKETHSISLSGKGVIGNPGSFTAEADGSDQIDLSWTKNANDSDVMIAWNSEGTFGVPTETYSVNDLIDGGGTVLFIGDATSFNHSDLNENTQYFYRAWSVEGTSYSAGVSANATTLCSPSAIPYSEDFETAVTPDLPDCTSRETISGNDWTTVSSPGSGFTSNTLRYVYNSAQAADSWFYTNGIELTGGTTYRITFRYGNNSTFYTEKLKVAVGTAPISTEMSTVLLDFPTINQNSPQNALFDFSVPTTGIYYFGFNCYSAANQWNLYIDDILIDLAPPTGTLAGQVTDGTRSPIEGARVFSGDYEAITDAGGNYEITDIFVGTYNFTCEADGYVTQIEENVEILDGETTVLDFGLQLFFPPVEYLTYEIENKTNVRLNWFAPGSTVEEWLFYHDGTFENAFASNTGGAGLAQLFVPDQHPVVVKEVRYFNSDSNQFQQQNEIYILNGDGSAILSGPYYVTNGPANDWVTVDIDDLTIESGNFMVATFNTSAGGPFVGVDNSISNGTLFFGSVGAFTELGVWSYFYVGSHEALVMYIPGGKMLAEPMVLSPKGSGNSSFTENDLAVSNTSGYAPRPQDSQSARQPVLDLTGYEIYRNGALLETVGETETEYFDDTDLIPGTYSYTVKAVYDLGISDPTAPVIVEIITCFPVTDLTAEEITGASAKLVWTAGEFNERWNVEWGEAGFTLGEGELVEGIEEEFYELTGLEPITTYEFYVQSDCNEEDRYDDVSTWVGPYSFTTTQIPALLPFTEDFEEWPSGWTVVNGTQTNQWHVGTATAYEGEQSAYISNDGGVTNAYSITATSVVHMYRDIEFTDLSLEFDLSFWWKGVAEVCCDYLRVYLVDTSVIPVAGNLLTSGQIGGNFNNESDWTEANFILPGNLSGQTRRLVFSWRNDFSVGTQPPVAIDNIVLTATPLPPYVVTVEKLTEDQLVITGHTAEYAIQINNIGLENDVYDLSITNARSDWSYQFPAEVSLNADQSTVVTLTVSVPESASLGETDEVIFTATSRADDEISDAVTVKTTALRPISMFEWTEDFDGLANGQLPEYWGRTHSNWGAINSNNAGGEDAPEMRFNWSPSTIGELWLVLRPFDTSILENTRLEFMHSINDYSGDYTLKVMSTTNLGETWEEEWRHDVTKSTRQEGESRDIPGRGDLPPALEEVDLKHLDDEFFYLAFVFEGNSFNINYWYIDDITITGDLDLYNVTFIVTDEDEDPIPGVNIDVSLEGSNFASVVTDAAGEALLELTSASYTFEASRVNYHPATGSFIVDAAAMDVPVTLIEKDPELVVNPTSHDFGEIEIYDESRPRAFTIGNRATAGGTLEIISVELEDATHFFLDDDNAYTEYLAAGETIEVKVMFKPTDVGNHSTKLLITYDDGSGSKEWQVFEVDLSGRGFTTSIEDFPWVELFTDDSESRPFWTQQQITGNANWTFREGSSGGNITSPVEGELNARFVSLLGSGTPITRLITPELNLSELDNPMISFYIGQQAFGGRQNQTKVYYRSDAKSDWDVLAEYPDQIAVWTKKVLPLPAGTFQVAFEGINYGGRANVIDVVTVADSYQVQFNEIGNGTLVAYADEELIQSGTFLMHGTDVLFEATPDEGYRIKEWKLNGVVVDLRTLHTLLIENLDEAIAVTVEFEFIEPPVLAVDPESLDGFTYIVDLGPSDPQMFTVSGNYLVPDEGIITITAPDSYELSLDGEDFDYQLLINYTDEVLADTQIYVRLIAGLDVGLYDDEEIAISGGGADDVFVALSGEVSPPPITEVPFTTSFEIADNWDLISSAGSYGEKAYEDGGWYFHSTAAVRGNLDYELFEDSEYAFRERGIFTVHNLAPASDMTGFSLQLFDWMNAAGVDRDLNISFDGGENWETVLTINKAWFDEYQTYQEFVYFFDSPKEFEAEEFMIQILNPNTGNNVSRINIGQFKALDEEPPPPPAVADPVFDLAAGNYFEDQTVFIDNYDDYAETVSVFYTLDGEDPDAESLLYNAEEGILLVDGDGPITLKAIAIDGEHQSEVTEAVYVFPFNVEDIATLRTYVGDGNVYRLTGGAIITLQGVQARNQRFIQDENAGILIDDNNAVLGEYDMGDVLENLIGTVGQFNNMLQFIPTADLATVAETGVFPDPLDVNIDDLNDDLQGMLIRVEELTYQGDAVDFAAGQNYLFHDKDDNALTLRTVFSDLDYIGTPIPETPQNIIGAHLVFGNTLQIVPRSLDDFEAYEEEVPDPDDELAIADDDDVTIGEGDIECFFALVSITIAGGDYDFVVADGGEVTLAAGQSIHMLPGTKVESGGYLHAYISTVDPCGRPFAREELPGKDEVITSIDVLDEDDGSLFFKLYPNPTESDITIEMGRFNMEQPVRIEVFNMMGNMVFSEEMPAQESYKLSLFDQQTGMYFVRVIQGDKVAIERLIKR